MLQLPNAVAVTVPKYDGYAIGEINEKIYLMGMLENITYYYEDGRPMGIDTQRTEAHEIVELPFQASHFKRATELSEDEAANFTYMNGGYFASFEDSRTLYASAKESLYSLLRSKGYEPESTLIIFKK